MRRLLVTLLIVLVLAPGMALSQNAAAFKNFNRYSGLAPGVDFFAGSKAAVSPFTQPVADARQRLESLLGSNLPKGAIFVCSSMQQKDSVWEPRALKMGYGWVLTVLTPEAQMDEFISRFKQMGVDIPPERLERMRSRMGQPGGGPVMAPTREMAHAILQVMLAPEKPYRSTRLDDVGRSPLPDWLDMAIAAYAGGGPTGVGYLQQHVDEIFTLDDMLTMSRPFVAPTVAQSPGGFVMRQGGGASGGSGGGGASEGPAMGGAPMTAPMPAPGGQGGSAGSAAGAPGRTGGGFPGLSKDQQDRLLFDSQAAVFFGYLMEKIGAEKTRDLISWARERKEPRDFLARPDVLGPDFDKIEQEWAAWVKAQKPDPREMRMDRGSRPPRQ